MTDYSVVIDSPGAFNVNYLNNGTADTIAVTFTDDANGAVNLVGDFGGGRDTWYIYLPPGATTTLDTTGQFNYGIIYFENGNAVTIGVSGAIDSITIVCFTRGTKIDTPKGLRAIETLAEGDLVITRDGTAKPVRWLGKTRISAETLRHFPEYRPIRIAAGALGENQETLVSPHHRMLLTGWRAEALFGEVEVLASAKSLINDATITVADVDEVEYFHILFDDHEIISADGAWSESFHPAALDTGLIARAVREEVLELFPELDRPGAQAKPARQSLSEADVSIIGL